MSKFYIKRNIDNIEIYYKSVKLIKFSKNSYIKVLLKKIYPVLKNTKLKAELLFRPVQKYKKLNDYVNYIITNNNINNNFIDIIKIYKNVEKYDTKLIAFYLPQYHSIPLNDKYHGKGFTDWYNVTRSIPQWAGHHQPQLPIDMGFYDLTDITILKRQVELAKMYGIYGFCFHYYWFSGEKLLEKPINNLLSNKDINMPFCICWANENWSTQWDGGNRQIIMKQELLNDDADKFINDILPLIKDSRYITINGKPVIIIYRPDLFDKKIFVDFISKLRLKAKSNGFEDLYIITAKFTFNDKLSEWNLDAMVEFPPHRMLNLKNDENILNKYINPNFVGLIYDMKDYIFNKKYLYKSDDEIFKAVFPAWDNSARKAYSGALVFKMTPELYKQWLQECIEWTKQNHSKDKQFVFINAWNEWAEGAHLEPDQKYGYAYLQATLNAINKK